MKNEHEESKEDPEKGNLFFNLRNIFSKKNSLEDISGKIIMVAFGAIAPVYSACLYFVQKKD